ncbi:phytanoyl-CoA dioxygenase family protein [Novosphingobium terrae]|uniref:phytanoyl-CoA dioxygenase family protein n=1 Tax=Novosphingobium terrae TaxID=2726189 RepID=UPI00198013D8|nr:phytanoyl-CoA dioxygenase family protein [Novosphingobium terrae]
MQHDALPAQPPHSPLVQDLRENGFLILPDLMPQEKVDGLISDLATAFADTPLCQGDFYGPLTQRYGGLLARSSHTADFVMHPTILQLCASILGPFCDTLQLNLTQGLAIYPGAPQQFPHRDQDMWRGAAGQMEYLINVMWPFTDYTSENGATLIWPESHAPFGLDQTPDEEPIVAEMKPGAALVFLGSTLHGAGANRSQDVRRGMIISYCLGWLKPYENQWLIYPPEIARTFSPDLAALVGYQQHRPNLGNVEGRCPSQLLRDRPLLPLGAMDALRPDQTAAVSDFAKAQP